MVVRKKSVNKALMMSRLWMRLLWNRMTRATWLWLFHVLPVRKGRVMLVSWGGKNYSCNPRFIAEALLTDEKCKDFDLNFTFIAPNDMTDVPPRIRKVQLGSLAYYYYLATARFIITNTIFSGAFFPEKKYGQLYIAAQHGGRGIKKIDFDDAEHLSASYLEHLAQDVSMTDLMLSDSTFRTRVIRSAFRYEGEILESGLPRNTVFWGDNGTREATRRRVLTALHLDLSVHCLLYAPTFRGNGRRDIYGFDIDAVLKALIGRFGGEWRILIGAHPNMASYYHDIYDFANPKVVDAGHYPDIQDVLVTADVLVTDYSSVAMDFCLQQKPVLSLVKDVDSYDRGLYLLPCQLPFPYAEDDDTLCRNILNFDMITYLKALHSFETEVMGLKETGHAAEAVVEWMKRHNR